MSSISESIQQNPLFGPLIFVGLIVLILFFATRQNSNSSKNSSNACKKCGKYEKLLKKIKKSQKKQMVDPYSDDSS